MLEHNVEKAPQTTESLRVFPTWTFVETESIRPDFASWPRLNSTSDGPKLRSLHGNQAAEIGSSMSVELNDSTAAAISICTIQSAPQSRMSPSASDLALVGQTWGKARIDFVPPSSSDLDALGLMAIVGRNARADFRNFDLQEARCAW